MERSGQSRRKKTVKTSPSPKRKKTKSQSNKIEVYKHFNPVNKLKAPVIQEEFPDFIVPDDDCGRSEKCMFKKTERRPRTRRRPSNSNVSNDDVIKLPLCDAPKKYACKSCDRSRVLEEASKSYMEEQPSVTKYSKQRLKSSSQSVSSIGSHSALNQVENRIKVNLDNIRKRDNVRLSINDMRCKLHNVVVCQRPAPQTEILRGNEYPMESTDKEPPGRKYSGAKATYVQQLKDEIHKSKPKCHEELKNSVCELRSEIAKYRETLHKNVNFLQGKLGPQFFDANLSCNLAKCPAMKDTPSQTEPMKSEVTQKATSLTEDVGCTCSILGYETTNGINDEPVCAIEFIEDDDQRMEPTIIEAVLENPRAPVESVNAEKQDEIDFYEHQKRNIQKVDHLIEEAEQSLIELKRGIYECSTVCQRNRVEVISEDSSEHCDCNDDLPTNQLIVPATPEEIDTAELFRDDFGTETNLIMPEDVEEEAEEDSHLNTISEKTEELDKSITSDLSSPVIERKEPVKKLTIQQMPLISIGRPLTLQKILQIDIQPNGCTNMSDPLIRNIHYEEIKHSECKAPFKANTDVAPFALDTTIILDVTEDKKYNEFQYLSTSSGEELLDDEEKSQVTDDNEVITSAIENDVGKNISSSDIEKDEVLEVIKIPSETKAPDVIDDLSKEVTEGTSDQGITGIPLDETVDIPKEENGSEKIITTIPADMNKPGDKKLCGCDAKGSPPPKIVNGNETITVEETTKIPSETKKSTLKELYDCADDRQPPPQSKTIQPTEKQVHSMQFDSDLEASTESHLSAVSALEVLSHISEDEAATDWTHENNGQINNPVSSKEKFSDDFESSESVYVLTHDVSVQAASDGHPNLKTDTKDESELNPKVVIRFSDPRAGRVTNNGNKASHRISNIKDKIKKKFSGESDRAILLLDSSSYDEESIYDGDIHKRTDTQTVMTVNVQYSNKDVQKAIEKSPVSGVKLHRSKCCKDVDTTTSYDSDSYNYESKNLPYRNTPCGDNMSSSDYLKLYSNGRYDDEAEDFYKSTRSDSINKNQKSKISKVQDQISVTTSDSVAYKLDETLSEGEIKCKCSTSIGELHVCRYAQEIKKQSQYLRKYPEKFLKYKLNENYKHYYSHRQKIYDKCLTHATSTSTSPVDTDSNNYSSDT